MCDMCEDLDDLVDGDFPDFLHDALNNLIHDNLLEDESALNYILDILI
jgi:hypothetical protein